MQKFIKFVSSTGEKEEVIVDINITLVHIKRHLFDMSVKFEKHLSIRY